MTQTIKGERIGQEAALRVGCSAVIFDETGQKVLLTRREDNGQWCLPGGGMEPGESAAETCQREVFEETGLQVSIERLVGIYTSPHEIIQYADGNKFQVVAMNFAARVTGGELGISDETTAYGYFSREEMNDMDILPLHPQRIEDAFNGNTSACIR